MQYTYIRLNLFQAILFTYLLFSVIYIAMPQVLPLHELALKYSEATKLTAYEHYVNVSDPSQYEFGQRSGLEVLASIDPNVEMPTIFDIDAGNGSFIDAAKQHYKQQGKDARTIGMVAVPTPNLRDITSEIVFGDFMRPETWMPHPSIPDDHSLDLAVANLAFMHFADPLHGLRVALSKLKDEASLYVSELHLCLDAKTASRTIDALRDEIAAHHGDYEPNVLTQPDYVEFENLHLVNRKERPFAQFDAIDAIKGTHRAIYTVSHKLSA